MDRKTRIREYKETRLPMGVFQIINKANGKMLIGSNVNLPAILNRRKTELNFGSHHNEVFKRNGNSSEVKISNSMNWKYLSRR